MNLKYIVRSMLRCCLHCGDFRAGVSQFCQFCEGDLWRKHSKLLHFELLNGSPGVSLFQWEPDQDRKVSKLMMALKGGELQEAFDHYSKVFIGKCKLPQNSKSIVLVPCPSTDKKRQHSQSLAKAFSEHLGLPTAEVLKKTSNHSQKNRTKIDRFETRMESCMDFSQHHVIFIDDIVTTGATALSAQMAIGPCLSFEVWCLAYRRQLAAKPLV